MWGFPQIDSAAVGCGADELDDLNFCQTSFPPDEFSAGRECDYIWLASLASSSVCARTVTGSLLFGSSHRLVGSCLCSAVLSLHWMESADVPQCRHLQAAVGCSTPDICSSTWTVSVEIHFRVTGLLIICCCFYRFFKERDIVSGRSPDRDQADPFYAPSRSVRLCDFVPNIQDAMELRALRPSAELVKTMSVRDSQGIRIVIPDVHVECGFHGFLFREMREEESSFVATGELDYLRGDWPRVLLALVTRYRQNLERKRKECKEWFGCTQSGNFNHCGKYILTATWSSSGYVAAWLCGA